MSDNSTIEVNEKNKIVDEKSDISIDFQLFIKNNLLELIQITIKERTDKGIGSLFLGYNEENKKIDCFYYPLAEKSFPEIYREIYTNLFEKNPSSIIYFHYFQNNSNSIVQYDLDKNRLL